MPHYSHGSHSFLIAEPYSDWNQPQYFDYQYWQRCGYLTNIAKGRGCIWFFSWKQEDFVLRHYHRGGKIAPIFGDRFIYFGLNRTRAWQEWQLLSRLYQQGLPVPKPIAAHVYQRGLFYQADIIMQRIPESKTLTEVLSSSTFTPDIWHELGNTLAEFHRLGVYHADLNAHNILVDEDNKIWLIDFDNCDQRQPQKKWQVSNINRLQRSLKKLQHEKIIPELASGDWETFLLQYQTAYASTINSVSL